MAALVDTNILVYLFDPSEPTKQRVAAELLDRGLQQDSVRIPHQAIVEFVSAVIRPRRRKAPLLSKSDATREAEELLTQFVVLYPNESVVRTALRGAAAYDLSWYDAHIWAYAEHFGLSELLSENFEHGRLYGTVRAVNPFIGDPAGRWPPPSLRTAGCVSDGTLVQPFPLSGKLQTVSRNAGTCRSEGSTSPMTSRATYRGTD